MMAIFFVFGLNILQFINVDSINKVGLLNSSDQLSKNNIIGQKELAYSPSQRAAAMVASNTQDRALIQLQQTNHLKSRHLLSDYDYVDDLDAPDKTKRANISKINEKPNEYNLTNSNNSSMDLVFINGTWHLVDLTVCYNLMSEGANGSEIYNHTHLNR